MINVLHYSASKSERSKLTSLPKTGVNWVDCEAPSREELAKIEKRFKINRSDIDKALSEKERARVIKRRNYNYILFKAPHFDGDILSVTILGVFIEENTVITIHPKIIKSINSLFKQPIPAEQSVFSCVINILRKVIDDYFTAFEKIEDKINDTEAKALKPTSLVAKEIFSIKKILIYFHKSLLSNREAARDLMEGRAFNVVKTNLVDVIELHSDILQLLDMSSIQLDILTNIIEIYMSSISNAMNDIVKRLTVVASFVLIPTLIASIYGMNFGQIMNSEAGPFNMPELNWYFGYPFALGIMLLSVILMAVYFKKKKWW